MFPNGMANWGGESGEFYVEQSGVVAAALAEAAVQDDQCVIRISPAVPEQWSMEAQIAVCHDTRVDVEVHNGSAASIAIEAGPLVHELKVINPWMPAKVEVWAAKKKERQLSGGLLRIAVSPGQSYLLKPEGAADARFAAVSGTPAKAPRELGKAFIGLESKASK